ncbi:spore germination protein [Hazenella sp. IB182353]|uniref:spore germination protein n=1 Tax=Polycladospora coralii TaxID=2771432 RepID=UPI001745D586|nr:spore germination protein [Polycladospora coralii]MBS7529419.1 spore germination protein [Polycladospora coralii]
MSQTKLPEWTKQKLNKSLSENIKLLDDILGVDESFDMLFRKLKYGNQDFAMYFVDGFVKDDILNRIMEHLSGINPIDLTGDKIKKLLQTEIPYIEIETTDEIRKVVDNVLSGPLVLLIDGETTAIVIDARTYPARGPEEPDIERVVRGSRDGFVETIIFNTALTRRRIRDPNLRFEFMQVGTRTKTDICVAYIKDVVDEGYVKTLKQKIEAVDIDGLPMAEKSLEEYIFRKQWNPYPFVRYTERPDVAAVHLLEGHCLVYVDTSPSVMITPSTFFHHVQHAEEYRQEPATGAFLRWTRLLAILMSLFLLPVWYFLATHVEILPSWLAFIGVQEAVAIPIYLQIILAEIGIEILRMASIHTPSPLATAMGLIAAILLGEIAIEVGWFSPEVILYVAIAVIGTFATPSYELGLANKLTRMILLTVTALFGGWGLVLGSGAWFIWLSRQNALNTPYLWPLIPFNGKALKDVLIRTPMPNKHKRPSIVSPQDPDTQ